MKKLFEPQGVALIGASGDPKRISGKPLSFFLKRRFRGSLYPVNPKHEKIFGKKCYRSILTVPDPVDLAIIMVDRSAVLRSIEECGTRGVPYAIIFSSGFAETGQEGRQLQNRILKMAQRHRVRIIGPNCMGLINTANGLSATFSLSASRANFYPGLIALVSQSGAFGAGIFSALLDGGIGVKYFVSTGNEADLQVPDYLSYFLEDGRVRVLAAYIEGLRNFQAFVGVADKAKRQGKVVIVLQAGCSRKGKEAALEHTGVKAKNFNISHSIFLKKDIMAAADIPDLLDLCAMASLAQPMQGNRLVVLSISGGANVIMADACAVAGLELPDLNARCRKFLKSYIPWYGSTKNPIDLTGNFLNNLGKFEEVLIFLLKQHEFDGLILFLTVMVPYEKAITEAILKAMGKIKKNIFLVWFAGPPGVIARLRQKGIAAFEDPSRTIRIIGKYYIFSQRISIKGQFKSSAR